MDWRRVLLVACTVEDCFYVSARRQIDGVVIDDAFSGFGLILLLCFLRRMIRYYQRLAWVEKDLRGADSVPYFQASFSVMRSSWFGYLLFVAFLLEHGGDFEILRTRGPAAGCV